MSWLNKHINVATSIAPLAAFRILFGLLMVISMVRFLLKDWVSKLYINPEFYFTYFGFNWVAPLNPTTLYIVFICLAIAAIGIMMGWHYKLSIVLFFIGFSYVELLDKSNYLNHYYFVSIISFLLILVPANRYFAVDVIQKRASYTEIVPAWCINIFKFQLIIVYFYAGLAKLNYDWLFNALPLKIWLPAHANMPIIGSLFTKEWVAYAFSWTGALYDLTIPFLLLFPRTRLIAFGTVVIFHLLTRLLFPIGMFPYIMIFSTLIFFSATWHERNFKFANRIFNLDQKKTSVIQLKEQLKPIKSVMFGILILYFSIQLIAPFRYLLYHDNLFWTEQGYRFSWRVMLAEKAGYATFYVKNPITKKEAQIDTKQYLCAHQEKQMSFQPDMILQFAHFLDKEYQKKGILDPEVRVEAYVALNGRKSRLLIDPNIDLSKQPNNLRVKNWILPYNSTSGQ